MPRRLVLWEHGTASTWNSYWVSSSTSWTRCYRTRDGRTSRQLLPDQTSDYEEIRRRAKATLEQARAGVVSSLGCTSASRPSR